MSIARLTILFVAAVLLHNLEEAIWLPAWSQSAGRWYQPVPQAVFAFAAGVFSLLLVGVAAASNRAGPRSIPAYLFAGLVVAMMFNAVLPHLALTIVMRAYMPGTLTGMLLNLPVGFWLLRRMLRDGYLVPRHFGWSAPFIVFGLAGFVVALLSVARQLFT